MFTTLGAPWQLSVRAIGVNQWSEIILNRPAESDCGLSFPSAAPAAPAQGWLADPYNLYFPETTSRDASGKLLAAVWRPRGRRLGPIARCAVDHPTQHMCRAGRANDQYAPL